MEAVFQRKRNYEEVSIEFHVNRGLVGRLVNAYKKDASIVDQMKQKEDKLREQVDSIVEAASEVYAQTGSIPQNPVMAM